jgi:biotin carboxyl carrier protein
MSDRSRKYRVEVDGTTLSVNVEERASVVTVGIDGDPHPRPVRVLTSGPTPLVLVGGRVVAAALGSGDRRGFALGGHHGQARTLPASRAASEERAALESAGDLVAPMPGRVVSVRVRAGDAVAAGAALVVIEAMKMQNELVAPRDGTVTRVLVTDGDAVERGATLVELT